MQILLVEHNQVLATALLKALQQQGYAANSVATGEAALFVIETEVPDIIVLDLGLPDIDGISVLKRVRRKRAGYWPETCWKADSTTGVRKPIA